MPERIQENNVRPRTGRLAPRVRRPVAHAAALAASLTLACGLAPAAWAQGAVPAQATARQHYEIPAGPLAPALRRLASRAGVMLSFTADQTDGQRTDGLRGEHALAEAFAQLLARSPWQAVSLGSGGYVLRSTAAQAGAATGNAATLATVEVRADRPDTPPSERSPSYAYRQSQGATGMSLSLRETPQSISIVTRQQMDDFQLNNVNDVLDATPGVVVERVETERTYYSARGFNITTFQDDGIGVPFTHGLMGGDVETAIYDRVEVIRGANGLMSNTGNPSATVNLVRKRPTADFTAAAAAAYGSWNSKRLEADVSGPLNKEGTLRGRFVAAAQDKDSYLDRYSHAKNTFYGVIEADIGDRTTLSAGITHQKSKAKGQIWGGLPLVDSDGTPTDYDRSTSTTSDWSRWNIGTQTTFVEATHRFDSDWEARAVYTHRAIDWSNRYFYVYGLPDRTTGLGLTGTPVDYEATERQDLLDIRASGPFTLGGRRHTLVFGANLSISRAKGHTLASSDVTLPSIDAWDGSTSAPSFTAEGGRADFIDKQRSMYAATRFNLADDLKLIVGVNATRAQSSGSNYGTSRLKSDFEIAPYAGVVYDINDNLSSYASFTKVFNPQSEIDANLKQLSPVRGNSVEAGLKTELFGKRLQGSVGVFKTSQKNLANYIGEQGLLAIYEGTDVKSQGVEFELAGQIGPHLQMTAGYTRLSLKDADGQATRLQTPRQIFRVSATYRVPGIERLQVGASLNWRSETSNRSGTLPAVNIRQPAYTLINLMARYDISDKVFLSFNLYNATDKKYLTSRRYLDQGFYGAPRNAMVAVNWKY